MCCIGTLSDNAMKLKKKHFEAIIIINKTDSKTLCKVLTEYHALSDGIVPPYTIENWQLAPDKHILSFPKGITFEEFDNLLTWLDNEIKSTKDIYGYNSTKRLKGIRTLEKAMFWIDPIYKVLYICIENGETYKKSDKETHKFERATWHKKYIPTQVQGWKNRARLIASYSFKPTKITKHSWISEMSFWCFMIIAFLTIIAGITFGRNTIFSYDVKFWLTILGILALSVGTVHVISPKEKQSLHHLVGKQKMYIINTFLLLSSISISLNYFISSGDAKQAIVTIDETWMNRDRHHLTFAKFRFPPHNNEKVSCNIPEDTYENIKPGDKCIVHYYKGIMGYLVIRSLTKVE